MRGPPPKPTALKLLNGNAGRKALPEAEPTTPPLDPTPPEWLDEAAKAFWADVVGTVLAMRVAQQSDRLALALLASTLAEVRAASERMAEEGRTITFDSGAQQVSPHFSIFSKSLAQAMKILAEFGMTPAARMRVRASAEKTGGDEFAEYLSRGGSGK